jgi:hypothetical protein
MNRPPLMNVTAMSSRQPRCWPRRCRTLLSLVNQVATPAPKEAGVDAGAADEPAEDALSVEAAEDPPVVVAEASVAVATPQGVGIATANVAGLLAAVTVERREDAGVRIEAPPHAAQALMSLFEGMARLMANAAPPPGGRGPEPVRVTKVRHGRLGNSGSSL